MHLFFIPSSFVMRVWVIVIIVFAALLFLWGWLITIFKGLSLFFVRSQLFFYLVDFRLNIFLVIFTITFSIIFFNHFSQLKAILRNILITLDFWFCFATIKIKFLNILNIILLVLHLDVFFILIIFFLFTLDWI